MISTRLPVGISVRELSKEELKSILSVHFEAVFHNRMNAPVAGSIGESAKSQIEMRTASVQRFELRLALFKEDKVVGWHYGYATDGESYYMQNSAVLPEFRNQGMYSLLLESVLGHLQAEGFQVITSIHHANNASVLIPKLKKGFIISGTQFHERFRFMVELKYFFNQERRKEFGKNLGLDI